MGWWVLYDCAQLMACSYRKPSGFMYRAAPTWARVQESSSTSGNQAWSAGLNAPEINMGTIQCIDKGWSILESSGIDNWSTKTNLSTWMDRELHKLLWLPSRTPWRGNLTWFLALGKVMSNNFIPCQQLIYPHTMTWGNWDPSIMHEIPNILIISCLVRLCQKISSINSNHVEEHCWS